MSKISDKTTMREQTSGRAVTPSPVPATQPQPPTTKDTVTFSEMHCDDNEHEPQDALCQALVGNLR